MLNLRSGILNRNKGKYSRLINYQLVKNHIENNFCPKSFTCHIYCTSVTILIYQLRYFWDNRLRVSFRYESFCSSICVGNCSLMLLNKTHLENYHRQVNNLEFPSNSWSRFNLSPWYFGIWSCTQPRFVTKLYSSPFQIHFLNTSSEPSYFIVAFSNAISSTTAVWFVSLWSSTSFKIIYLTIFFCYINVLSNWPEFWSLIQVCW
jgi:Pyruvate/2-oxoacid:ferredoxin oxidoreductase delta subunit